MSNNLTSSRVDVKVQNISGHSMSHRNSLTSRVGTLTPVLVEEVCPNSRMHLSTSFSVKLPPLASETFANLDYRLEAFFVPHRLLVRNFTNIIDKMISEKRKRRNNNTFLDIDTTITEVVG